MGTYLSIDLDYWTYGRGYCSIDCGELFEKVLSLGLPISFVKYHNTMLKSIDKFSGIRQIINIDYHADIADVDADFEDNSLLNLNTGTWANYVKPVVRKNGKFVWFYPRSQCCSHSEGYCHAYDCENPFDKPKAAGWADVDCGVLIDEIPWKDVTGVGVALSPDYTECLERVEEPLRQLSMWDWAKRACNDRYKDMPKIGGRTPFRPKVVLPLAA